MKYNVKWKAALTRIKEKKNKKRKEKLANYLTNQGNYFSLSVGQLAVGLLTEEQIRSSG